MKTITIPLELWELMKGVLNSYVRAIQTIETQAALYGQTWLKKLCQRQRRRARVEAIGFPGGSY
jgi:hypothetical protein